MRWKLYATLLGSFVPITCGPGDVVQAELDEICGVTGPFRVLELPPDQQLTAFATIRVGDRVLYHVHQRGEDSPGAIFPSFTGSSVWSVGPCGESPVQLHEDIVNLFTLDVWPDEALACTTAGDVVRLDPYGEDPTHVVFAAGPGDAGCGTDWTPHGLLRVEDHGDGTGALVLHPYPVDPRSEAPDPRVLLDPILTTNDHLGVGQVLRTYDEFALATTTDGTMVRVQIAYASVTTLQPGVRSFSPSKDGGQFVWESDDGDLSLRDLAAGSDVFLAHASLADSLYPPLSRIDQGIVEINLGAYDAPKRLYFLPDFDHIDIPGDLQLKARLDEHRWLTSYLLSGLLDVFDLRTLDTTPLFPREGEIQHVTPDTVELFDAPPCCITGSSRDEGPIWRVPVDGSEPHRIVDRATRLMHRRDDGRYLGPVSVDEQWLGPLVIVDPDTGEEQRIDDHVFSFSITAPGDDDLITYSLADGDRSGIWIARLSAGPRDRAASLPLPPIHDLLPGPDGRPQLRLRAGHSSHIRTGAAQRTYD